MNFSFLSLRAKILWIILGVSIATLASMILMVLVFIKPRLESKLEKRGQSIAHAISSQCINPILSRKFFEVDLLFREFVIAEDGVEYIYVRSGNGDITAHSFGRKFPVALKTVKPKLDKDGHGIARIRATDHDIIEVSLPLLDGALGSFHVGMSASPISQDVNDILLSFISIGILFCLSSLLLLVFLEKWITSPILKIKAAAAGIGKGELEGKVEITSQDEVGALAAEFNSMIDEIKDARNQLLHEKSLLEESEERFSTIIHKSPISMAIVSMDGTIEYINDYAVATFGYLPKDIPHMDVWWQKAYPDPTYRKQVVEKWTGFVEQAIAGSNYIERSEYRVTCKDGAIKIMMIFGVILPDKVFVVFEDITARKSAEEEILRFNSELGEMVSERTTELQRINRDLVSFCYAISHELRAPVARLKGLSQALQEELATNPAEAEQCARRITVASYRLQRVIDSVLNLSRLSQAPFSRQPLNLSTMAQEITTTLVKENSGRHIDITIAENITSDGDSALVHLCLENLLNNAVKYTVRQPVAKIEFGRDPKSGAFFVRDNGIGFNMANASKLFEPFVRLHREEEFIGSGIGLATVQRIIERHGGMIRAESAPDNGTVFYFTLSPSNGQRHDT